MKKTGKQVNRKYFTALLVLVLLIVNCGQRATVYAAWNPDAGNIDGVTIPEGSDETNFARDVAYSDFAIIQSKVKNNNCYFVDGDTLIPFMVDGNINPNAKVNGKNGTFVFDRRNVSDADGNIRTWDDVWYVPKTAYAAGEWHNINETVTLLFEDAAVDVDGIKYPLKT